MKWFKFYGQDFFTDPKMMMLTPAQKMFFVGLMSLASQEDKTNDANGTLTLLTENVIMQYVGILPETEGWKECSNLLDKFEVMGLISIDFDNAILTINNFQKLQKTNLTASERVTKSRRNKSKQSVSKKVNTANVNANKKLTLDKDRDIDKEYVNTTNVVATDVAETEKALTTNNDGDPINHLIGLFESVNPNYQRLFQNKTERASMDRMEKAHGVKKMEMVLKLLPQTNGLPYAPIITTCLELERKMGALSAFLSKQQKEGGKVAVQI